MEQDFMREPFDEIAVEGAILLTYHQSGEIYANRKVHSESAEYLLDAAHQGSTYAYSAMIEGSSTCPRCKM